ncbi:metacaspase-9-like [Silene latifolia]|uniref:metacaspase-9-like n=1 Tax=Silene latifolia TaxID=37657 RepID=UPI003D77ACBF
MDFRQLVNMIHHKATFTILTDSCHSGGLIYQEKEQIGPSANPPKAVTNSYKRKCIPIEDIENMFQQNTGLYNLNIGDFMTLYFRDEASLSFQPSFRLGFHRSNGEAYDNGVLLSACQNNELAVDGSGIKPPHGMFSHAVMTVLENSGQVISNRRLVMVTRKFLEDTQHPCLYCSDENADATFLLQHQAYTN